MVLEHVAADPSSRGSAQARHEHHPACPAGCQEFVPTNAELVTGTAQHMRKAGVVTVVDLETEQKRRLIDLAYRLAETVGIPVWCQDEAGPYGTGDDDRLRSIRHS